MLTDGSLHLLKFLLQVLVQWEKIGRGKIFMNPHPLVQHCYLKFREITCDNFKINWIFLGNHGNPIKYCKW